MKEKNLKSKFTKGFFEEFQYDPEFRSIFLSMEKGLTPYKAIEYLCKSKKELFEALEFAMKNTPRKIFVTTEEMEELLDEEVKEKFYCQGDGCNSEIGEPRFCCNTFDCGCQGLPIDPPFCSSKCMDNFKEDETSFPF